MNQFQPVPTGHLRWVVVLAHRDESPTFNGTGITETIIPIATVYASIDPVGTQIFLNSEQLETPITHVAYMQWQPFENLEMFNIVLRTQYLPDTSVRTETFRVRRASEWNGRNRYIRMDLELESYSPLPTRLSTGSPGSGVHYTDGVREGLTASSQTSFL